MPLIHLVLPPATIFGSLISSHTLGCNLDCLCSGPSLVSGPCSQSSLAAPVNSAPSATRPRLSFASPGISISMDCFLPHFYPPCSAAPCCLRPDPLDEGRMWQEPHPIILGLLRPWVCLGGEVEQNSVCPASLPAHCWPQAGPALSWASLEVEVHGPWLGG